MTIFPRAPAPDEDVPFYLRKAAMGEFRVCSFGPSGNDHLVHTYRGDFPDKSAAIEAAAAYVTETHGAVIHDWRRQVWVCDPGQPIEPPRRHAEAISVTKLAGLHEIKAKPGKYRRK